MTSDTTAQQQDSPAGDQASSAGDSHSTQRKPRTAKPVSRAPRKRPRPASKVLIDTAGPEPDSRISDIRLTIGVIGGTHGVQGELKLKLLTDHPEHLPSLTQVYLGESDVPTKLLGVRFQGDQALIQLDGVTNPEHGKLLGGLKVRIDGADAKPLEEGEYFLFQLVGLRAQTASGESIGTVTDIFETGANDVLVITPESGTDLLVPNHPRFVLEISPDQNRIVIDPPVYDS
jgi:16S rRNA processing protein RimM